MAHKLQEGEGEEGGEEGKTGRREVTGARKEEGKREWRRGDQLI
jgi:hypothetical protein